MLPDAKHLTMTNLRVGRPKLIHNLQTMDLSFFIHNNVFQKFMESENKVSKLSLKSDIIMEFVS